MYMNKFNGFLAGLSAFALMFGGIVAPAMAKVEREAGYWMLNAPAAIAFSCGGGIYNHTLETVVNEESGDFTGIGAYDLNKGYTWDVDGKITGDEISFLIEYTGLAFGTVYTLNGTIASDGSVSGSASGNCQTFTMPGR